MLDDESGLLLINQPQPFTKSGSMLYKPYFQSSSSNFTILSLLLSMETLIFIGFDVISPSE